MSLEFTMGSGGLPVGSYRAEFVGAELYEENVEKYGQGVLLKWQVTDGEQNGNETTRITSAKMTPRTILGKFAVALKGSAIARDENFAFANYVGVTGNVIVEATDSGGSRVSLFMRDAQPSPQATAQPSNGQGQVAMQPPTPERVEQF